MVSAVFKAIWLLSVVWLGGLRFEGLVIRLIGDGRPYSLVLETDTPHYRPAPAQPAAAGVGARLAPVQEEAEVEEGRGEVKEWTVDDWMMSSDDEELDGAAFGAPKGQKAAAVAPKPPPSTAAASLSVGGGGTNGAASGANGSVKGVAEPCQYVARFSTRKGPATVSSRASHKDCWRPRTLLQTQNPKPQTFNPNLSPRQSVLCPQLNIGIGMDVVVSCEPSL